MSTPTRTYVREALARSEPLESILVQGWVRTRRDAKGFSFVEINDGTCLGNLQVIADAALPEYDTVVKILASGAGISVEGRLAPSQGKGQRWEVLASKVVLHGNADASYPLQKKGHSREFLREIAHLRPRSNLFGCIFRLRSRLAHAIHTYFQDRHFVYIHTPIITANDCEGAGELFHVTTLDLANPPRTSEGTPDFSKDFFEVPTYLTVSGQLEAEVFSAALSNVYTFGPTFRAENSNTWRHASEFWMVEPEMSFCDIHGNMDLVEDFTRYLVRHTLETSGEEIDLFTRFVDKSLRQRLEKLVEQKFARITYEEALAELRKSGRTFDFPVEFGEALQTEHERFLADDLVGGPVAVYNYPKSIKPFYMRQNEDGRTVAAMDVLIPGIGEFIGGSQREERLDRLEAAMEEHHLDRSQYQWFLDLRRYGSVPHSGFGMGFERMLMFLSGIPNIRDVIPFPRTPGNAAF